MPNKVEIQTNFIGVLNSIKSNQAKAIYSMAQTHRQRSDSIAPKDTRALVNSSQTSGVKMSGKYNAYATVENKWGDGSIKYARRRWWENSANPYTLKWTDKGYKNNEQELMTLFMKELG